MPLMVHGRMILTPNKELDLTSLVVTTTPIEVPDDRVAVYALANVPLHRQLEIVDAWYWLWNGVRDRNLLDSQFAGSKVYSGAPIDDLTIPGRKTASVISFFTADDVVIGLGASVTGAFKGAVVPLESAFEKLREISLERYFKLN